MTTHLEREVRRQVHQRLKLPKKPYAEVESEFIKQQIKERDFDNPEDRKYINRLVRLEHDIQIKAHPDKRLGKYGYGAMALRNLKKKHNLQEEYDTIQKEVQPEEYKKRKQRKKKKREKKKKIKEKFQKKRLKQFNKARKQWQEVQHLGTKKKEKKKEK